MPLNSRHPLQHTFDNVRTASGNNQQRPPVEMIAERLSYFTSRPQNVHLWWPPSYASICRTFSIISEVLLVDGRPERGSSSVVVFPSRKHKHIFCSGLSSRTPAPTLRVSLLQFSQICSRICLHVAPFRCDTTSHTDLVQLAAVGLYCWSHAVHAVCRFYPCLWRTMRMRVHMRQAVVQIWHHSPNFLDTPCIILLISLLMVFEKFPQIDRSMSVVNIPSTNRSIFASRASENLYKKRSVCIFLWLQEMRMNTLMYVLFCFII